MLLVFLSNTSYCNELIDEKKLIISGNKAFNQKKEKELLRIKASTSNEELNHWFDFWLIKLKIMKNPFDKNIKVELYKFSKSNKLKSLTIEAYKFWAHEVIKTKDWKKISSTISQIKAVSPLTTSNSIECVNYLSKSKKTLPEIEKLTSGQEFRIGCLKLILSAIELGYVGNNFIFKSARSAAIYGNIIHAQKILKYSEKNKINIPTSEYKLIKVLAVSQKNSLRALRRLKLVKDILTKEQKSFVSMVVGSSLSGITHPSSLNLVKQGISSAKQQSTNILESSARVALRYADWDLLGLLIRSMPLQIQKLPKWKYWEAQRLLIKGEKIESARLLNSIKPPWSFYGMLSGEELANIYNPKKHVAYRIPPQEQENKAIVDSSNFRLALLFYEARMYKEGRKEWDNILDKESDKSLINISSHLKSIEIFDRSISAALKTKNNHNFYLRFPIPHQQIVKKESLIRNISPFLMMGLMRQESRFNKKISSSAGAIGLMQLMPSTARSVARKIKLKPINKASLHNPQKNIKLGSAYLSFLFAKFNKSSLLTIASYNAGASRSKKWKKSLVKKISGAAFTESIPFDETREYVKSVLSGAVMYSRLYDNGELRNLNSGNSSFLTLQSLLGDVEPNKKK